MIIITYFNHKYSILETKKEMTNNCKTQNIIYHLLLSLDKLLIFNSLKNLKLSLNKNIDSLVNYFKWCYKTKKLKLLVTNATR